MRDEANLLEVEDDSIRVFDTIDIDYAAKEVEILDARPLYDMIKSGAIGVLLNALDGMKIMTIALERKVAAFLTVLFDAVYRYQVDKWDLKHIVRVSGTFEIDVSATGKATVE